MFVTHNEFCPHIFDSVDFFGYKNARCTTFGQSFGCNPSQMDGFHCGTDVDPPFLVGVSESCVPTIVVFGYFFWVCRALLDG